MHLRTYLSEADETMTGFAARVGVSVSTVHGWVSGRRTPSLATVRAIRAATGGAVTADDFVEPTPSKEAAA
jgi:DNA-binding transcriptional regulator YdaS (Cro superfamily)